MTASSACRAKGYFRVKIPTPVRSILGVPFFMARSEFMSCAFNNLIIRMPRRSNCRAAHLETHLPGASHEARWVEWLASLEEWLVVCLGEWVVVCLEGLPIPMLAFGDRVVTSALQVATVSLK